jgi:pimeloyl-ACP methyl ester carboxylesterase
MNQTIDDVAFREAFADADGFHIRYLQAGTGDPVLRIHGAAGLDLTRSDALLAQKYRVIAVEVPGFGGSDNDRSKSPRDLAHTMVAFIQALGLERYSLIGNSLGARIALWQALEDGDNIDALILMAPGAVVPEGWRPPSGPDIRHHLFAHPEQQPEAAHVDPAIRDKQRAFIQRALTPGQDAELEERLGEVNVATLVVFGTEDTFIPTEMARVYKAKIPNCSYAMVYDAGHMIEAERPEACAELLDDFLERKEVFVVARNSTVINP